MDYTRRTFVKGTGPGVMASAMAGFVIVPKKAQRPANRRVGGSASGV